MNVRQRFEATKKRRQILVQAMPEIMGNSAKNTSFSHADAALDSKTKELISLAMSIMIKCEECIDHHIVALFDLGCTYKELVETLQLAITLQSCPGIKYSQYALECYVDLLNEHQADSEQGGEQKYE